MAKPTGLPQQALDGAAPQAQEHLPTTLPPTPPTPPTNEVTLPDGADHMSLTGIAHLPDFLT